MGEWTHPARGGANHCSDENGGQCLGPGRIYYGDALTFTYEDVEAGKTISCSNSAFGCDPLPLWKKKCFNGCRMKHRCPNTGAGRAHGLEQRVAPFVACDCVDARNKIEAALMNGDISQYVTDAMIEDVFREMRCVPPSTIWETSVRDSFDSVCPMMWSGDY